MTDAIHIPTSVSCNIPVLNTHISTSAMDVWHKESMDRQSTPANIHMSCALEKRSPPRSIINRCFASALDTFARPLQPSAVYYRPHYTSSAMPSPASSSGAARRYRTLLQRMSTSPKLPVKLPSMYSSVDASWRFM